MPKLIGGESFRVLPALGRIVLMLDHDGDENYEPHLIPLDSIESKFTTIGEEREWSVHTLKDNHQKWP